MQKIKIHLTLFYSLIIFSDYIIFNFTTSVLETFFLTTIKLRLLIVVRNPIQIAINRTHLALSFRVVSASFAYKFRVRLIKNSVECKKSRPNPGSCFFSSTIKTAKNGFAQSLVKINCLVKMTLRLFQPVSVVMTMVPKLLRQFRRSLQIKKSITNAPRVLQFAEKPKHTYPSITVKNGWLQGYIQRS